MDDGIIEVKRKPIKCPICGFKPVGTILYGMPMMDDELEKEIESGTTIIGGCCVLIQVGVPQTKWECKKCGTQFK
jgi:rubrerythrin